MHCGLVSGKAVPFGPGRDAKHIFELKKTEKQQVITVFAQ
jgi:hypothetical protein